MNDFPLAPFALLLALASLMVLPAPGRAAAPADATAVVIDTGQTMQGAYAAASAEAARRILSTQHGQPVAVIGAGAEPSVLVPPTTDTHALAAGLRAAGRTGGTGAIMNATRAALVLLGRTNATHPRIVVLTAGTPDPAGAVSAQSVLQAARAAHVTVDVASFGAITDPLTTVVAGTRGQVVSATADRFVPAALALVPAPPHAPVSTTPVHHGASGRPRPRPDAAHTAAAGAHAHAVPDADRHPSSASRSSTTFAAAGALLLLCGLLLATARPAGKSAVAGRLDPWVSGEPVAEDAEDEDAEDRRAPSLAVLLKIQAALERADMPVAAERFVVRVAGVAAGAAVVVSLVGGLIFGVLAAGLVLFGARTLVRTRAERRRRAFAAELADTIQAIASAMRAGHGLSAAVATVAEDAGEPMASELQRVVQAERLGASFDEAMQEAVRRTGNRDLSQLALVASLQREVGGNGAEALDRIVDSVRNRDEVRRLVRTLTAQAQMTRWVLTGLPVALVLALVVIGKGYMDPLFDTTTGRVLILGSVMMIITGSMWIKRIATIEV